MKNISIVFILLLLLISGCQSSNQLKSNEQNKNFIKKGLSQPEKKGYWQQYVYYKMDIDMDVEKHQYKGKQHLLYKNNSPDTLYNVYYHLQWNAFQPESAMDWRSRTLPDPDRNLDKTIRNLKPDEIGYIKIHSLKQDGNKLNYRVVGTILEVKLNKPILPGASSTFDMEYLAQVPKMVRRSGRDSKEGVDYSIAQWYPKMAEYDRRGWHSDPYLGREFYGVWGDFDVTIHIDKNYVVVATGTLQNPENIPDKMNYPTEKNKQVPKEKKLTWHFKAQNVHDFSWAADPDYIHDILKVDDDLTLHFFYLNNNEENIKKWKKLQPKASETMKFYNNFIGKYPYKQYSVIQAGDGGMEYAQLTFVYGNKNFKSLLGTVQHEMAHAWFQFALATNESEYPWMDEGFTVFLQDMANIVVNKAQLANPFERSYSSYIHLMNEGKEEPLSTHSDYYLTNLAYWINAYNKGSLVLSQLGYIMGFDKLQKTLQNYYKNWKMKHPQPEDFFRIAEITSGMNLKWYFNQWINTTHYIDYKIEKVEEKVDEKKTKITLKNIGEMPMPIDLLVVYRDGSNETFNIPLDVMRGNKEKVFNDMPHQTLKIWEWTIPEYQFTIPRSKNFIQSISIDPLGFMADVNQDNNFWTNEKEN